MGVHSSRRLLLSRTYFLRAVLFAVVLLFSGLGEPLSARATSHGLAISLGLTVPLQAGPSVWTSKPSYRIGEVVTVTMSQTQALGFQYYVIIYRPDGSSLRLNFALNSNSVTTLADQPGSWRVELWGQPVVPNPTPTLQGTCMFTVQALPPPVITTTATYVEPSVYTWEESTISYTLEESTTSYITSVVRTTSYIQSSVVVTQSTREEPQPTYGWIRQTMLVLAIAAVVFLLARKHRQSRQISRPLSPPTKALVSMSEAETKFCIACGVRIPATAGFCRDCGAKQN